MTGTILFLDDYQLPAAVVRLPSSRPAPAGAVEEIFPAAREHHRRTAARTSTGPGTQPSGSFADP